ncbi:HLH-domain-containing protein [Suhomyces tanzawaensis NRRL Y-17324]|uniref:HLH-domain-containing protein n=1 Tax=Suhomyces tanzawaensis NRRL Y-17324 TaxID=984487 RepID=A0A1E4SET7_9ASCO|nr:HLH-domain-containing protein [Suhomyces tanzawaensis NRRL Y-17324]ODV77976.1 HLH-domain-containing protein [Suhomyces tanzawaensis NRRL Y-17324]
MSRRRSVPRGPRKKLTASQKQAHNKIEKKYRININEKIAGLQKIIPAVANELVGFETVTPENAEHGCQRLNKSAILEKATEYILLLQKKLRQLMAENTALKNQILRHGGTTE